MLPFDLALAIAGRVANEVGRWVDDSDRARWSIVAGLLLLSAIPIAFVGSSPRPTDLTFDDVRQDHIPAMTSWVRLEGELRQTGAGGSLYELHDSHDDAMYVIVIAEGSLPLGHTIVTGRISPRVATTGNVGTIEADVPAVPRVDEPIWLYLTPGVIAILIAIGIRAGYPVIRRERGSGDRSRRLAPGESLAVRWSGRIGSESVARFAPKPGTLEIATEPDLAYLSLTTGDVPRTIRMRRPASAQHVRLCRVTGREAGLEVHGQNADLVFAFDDRAARDRLAATLR
ncbi:MAG TPA: hypothetical protein VIM25_04550 [Candidatus Limnocylindrales bacterium]